MSTSGQCMQTCLHTSVNHRQLDAEWSARGQVGRRMVGYGQKPELSRAQRVDDARRGLQLGSPDGGLARIWTQESRNSSGKPGPGPETGPTRLGLGSVCALFGVLVELVPGC